MTLRVAFLGNDAWSVPSLDAIAAERELSLVQVVTNPPKEAGRGATLNLTATFNPTIHLELAAVDSHQWLHVDDSAGVSQPVPSSVATSTSSSTCEKSLP